jgi:hypothetical protein
MVVEVPMTEQQWLVCEEPQKLLRFLAGKVSDRKLRLYSCACCRRIWHLLKLPASRRAVDIAEKYADGLVSIREVEDACREAETEDGEPAECAAFNVAWPEDEGDPETCAAYAAEAVLEARHGADRAPQQEPTRQSELVRHLVGNPFRPYPAPPSWPSLVIHLAQSLYDGDDCRLPLSDALEESGHEELAEHFREEDWHPKGCFAMDLIRGKE